MSPEFGRYDGDIYTHYLATVQAAPNCYGRPDYWEDLVRPLTHPDEGLAKQLS